MRSELGGKLCEYQRTNVPGKLFEFCHSEFAVTDRV